MDEGEQTAAAGWYPAEDGTPRYWDGEKWLSLPPPGPAHPNGRSRFPTWLLVGLAVALIAVLVGVGYMIKADRDRAAAEESARAEEAARVLAAEEAASIAAAEEEERAREEEEQERRREDRERDARRDAVEQIEASIVTMAEGHVASGLIDGPILDAICSPVAGGSIDDLTEQTTVFACFVVSEENEDGTKTGYNYNATMNWTTDQFTYGFGAP